ncbi:hypothetical protein BpJC7_28230 [Weizmannia acidilactici]|uniref:Maltodextrose utilization protein MalA n=1 Tax=Weizmannia acidilactici TaxID=2607726 RepID=A0A5J4JLL7_9BACI|nr:DUF1189 domain-containing protein [Weizmannia acidilactici]GER68409.1 hypothetical protein BpJC4_28800 [Weizmannia acidilactici]GER71520.1 hypothetical protein BpJC7_28230 [Weizmannia acidilactici]GER72979.1 hypothetical protein BpPP18_10460 [Weizmannia acidilactici]
MEQIQRFPANYFANIFSPAKMFQHRGELGWLKITLVFLFLNACLVAPFSLSFARAESFDLSRIAPHLNQAVQTGYTGPAVGISFKNGALQAEPAYETAHGNTIITIGPNKAIAVSGDRYHKKVAHYKNALIFQKHRLILADENGFGFSVRYPDGQADKMIRNGNGLAAFAAELWFRQYKVILVPLVSCLILAMLFFSNFILMGAVSLILWMTKFSSFSGIRTLKQAASITVFAAGIPSIAAMLAGFAGANITALLMIQSLGIVLVIAFIFFKTKFLAEENLD